MQREHPGPGPAVRRTILALFFLSGACGLVYEVVWMRMLTLVFGATAFATSTILSSFFAGLALGSYLFGRLIDRGRNPLRVYAALEAGIGIIALVMPLVFVGLTDAYVAMARALDLGYYQFSLLRFVLAFSVLMIPATLMGGTLPVMVKYFVRHRDSLAGHVGRLYGINTLGAVVGASAAGFFLILALGTNEAGWLAAVVNLLIAGAVLALARRVETTGAPAVEADAGESDGTYSRGVARLVLVAAGVSGLCALALEVLWTRALVFFLDNSTHAFTTILTAFLLGIALGSLVVGRFIDRRQRLVGWLGLLQVLLGLSAVVAIPILNGLSPVFESLAGEAPSALLPWKWLGMRFAKSLAVMIVPTLLMGMSFPIITKIYARRVERVGTALGSVYSVNTVGGVVGSAVAGFLLVPAIGVQNAIAVVAAVNVILGLALLLAEPGMRFGARVSAVAVFSLLFVGVGALALSSRSRVLTSYWEELEGPDVLFYSEGVGATVKVYADAWGGRVLSVNGFPVAGTPLPAQDAQKALAHLPLFLSDVPSPRVNIVGFGAGGTSWGVTRHDVERVDCVELVPKVPEAAWWFPEVNHWVRDDPRFNLILGDGRNYALITDREYDVVSVDATSPKMAGNGSLYSKEFYELARENLSDRGLMVQWIPFHLLSGDEMRMIARTFLEVFPNTTVWFTPLRNHVILVGTVQELEIDFQALQAKMADPAIQMELAPFQVRDAVDVLSWFIMGPRALAEYVGEGRLNTDNHPYLEFTPAMAYFVSAAYRVESLGAMREYREPVLPRVTGLGDTPEEEEANRARLERRFVASQYSLSGDILMALGEEEEAVVQYRTALLYDPDEINWLNAEWGYAGLEDRPAAGDPGR